MRPALTLATITSPRTTYHPKKKVILRRFYLILPDDADLRPVTVRYLLKPIDSPRIHIQQKAVSFFNF